MKKYVFLLAGLVSGAMALAQTPACCIKPSGNSMQSIALTAAFIAAHEAPIPFELENKRGSMITFNTPDGKTGSAYYVPSHEATSKVLIVFHEWWGLNDYIKREAQRWQDSLGAIDVYAVDLYDGVVASKPEEASKLSSGLNADRAAAIVKGVVTKAGRDAQITTIGWCMGGGYSFAAAVAAGSLANGCVMYYGFPEKDNKKIKPLQTDVLYIHGTQDKFISRDAVLAFGEQVKATGHKFTYQPFDADHGFANPSNPHFNEAATAQAQALSMAFLRKYLALD